MEDSSIVDLFFDRAENAIKKVEEKYGTLGNSIAWNILRDTEEVQECLNDAYLALWNQIPPEKPGSLQAYFCRIVRNTALNQNRKKYAEKRFSPETVCYDELAECIAAKSDLAEEMEQKEITKIIEQFLDTLKKEERVLFVKRYWQYEKVKDIAQEMGLSQRHASVKLGRIRKQLKRYLEKEGWLSI